MLHPHGHNPRRKAVSAIVASVSERKADDSMADLRVNGAVLASARTMRGISVTEAAKRLSVPEDDLRAIEKTPLIVLKQSLLRKMSDKYRVAYGYLFMAEPLPLVTPKQYRTFRGRPPQLSEQTLHAWADVTEAVDSFAEIRASNSGLVDVQKLSVITQKQNIEDIAKAERAKLRVTLAQQLVWTDAQARNAWRAAIESLGIFVYFMAMPRGDCMGFSVLDERGVPAICVNDNHELMERQKIFTMLHEYCHLLLRKPGISDQGRGNTVEKFCNQFAAAVLVPKEALRQILPGGGPTQNWSTKELRMVSNRFKVSMEVIAFRIEDIKMAKPGFHDRKVAEWNALGLLKKKPSESHPNVTWPERIARRLGRKHTATVFNALDHGALSFIEARDLIGLSPRHFDDVKAATG